MATNAHAEKSYDLTSSAEEREEERGGEGDDDDRRARCRPAGHVPLALPAAPLYKCTVRIQGKGRQGEVSRNTSTTTIGRGGESLLLKPMPHSHIA